MPTAPDHFFACHPLQLDGAEVEGGAATPIVDTASTLYVDVLWGVPRAGDILTAYAVGGRWVTERAGTPPSAGFPCGNCPIPKKDLTVSWTNPLIGDGSAPLVFNGTDQWQSACSHELLYQLLCTNDQVEFRVNYFTSGSCPDGQSQYCSTLRNSPFRLNQTGLICGDHFLLTCTCGMGCPSLGANGFASFTVSS